MSKQDKPDVFDGFTALTDSLIGDVKLSSKASDDDVNIKTYDNIKDGLDVIDDDDDTTVKKDVKNVDVDDDVDDIKDTDDDIDDDSNDDIDDKYIEIF